MLEGFYGWGKRSHEGSVSIFKMYAVCLGAWTYQTISDQAEIGYNERLWQGLYAGCDSTYKKFLKVVKSLNILCGQFT